MTLYILLLVAVPANLVFGPLGAAGTPAQIWGMVLLLLWVSHRLAIGPETLSRPVPVRRAMLFFAAAMAASYVAAAMRPISSIEIRAADRGLLSLCAWMGVFMAAHEGLDTRQRLDTIVRRLVLAGGGLASLGLVQYVTRQSFVERIRIPGLASNSDSPAILIRDGLARPAGTATHPIEFGVVLAMLLPLALHYAMTDIGRNRLRRWYPVAAIGLAIPISVSRSAVLSVFVSMMILLPTWSANRRRFAYAGIVAVAGLVYVMVPGLLGALRTLFLGIGSDASTLSRTDSYNIAFSFIERAPIFGRGFGTFLPSYRILDNQYLLSTIETGIVGLVALLALLGAGILAAPRVRRCAKSNTSRDLAQALGASIAAGAVSFATFDSLSFPMIAGVMFLVLGCMGAMLKIESEARRPVEVV